MRAALWVRFKRISMVAAGLAAALMLVLSVMAWTIWSYGYSGRNATDIPADAAIVLGAAAWDCKPSPVLQGRIGEAIRLYRDRTVPTIIFTGGTGSGESCSEAEASREYALRQGVPANKILIETKSRITEENIQFAAEAGRQQGMSRFYIISDPLHMKRAMRIAEEIGMDALPAPATTSVYRSWRSKLPFLARETVYWAAYELSLLLPASIRSSAIGANSTSYVKVVK
ncbi:YdcF family protein [Paenibacillus pasadenensis]|uniref:YdcF family protein n=1 Tax=Paenibacillus pasadenensis TaxID=217090 RepID=UPI002041E4C7|nr:YdcF family protein [Paenibacillus pasadenensis]MCM3748374.1 YdcF family protein [Paenibacillus pasadenensis]